MGTFILEQSVENPVSYTGNIWNLQTVASGDTYIFAKPIAIGLIEGTEAFVSIPFSGATPTLYLDGSPIPTAFNDLPDDFGITSINFSPVAFSNGWIPEFLSPLPNGYFGSSTNVNGAFGSIYGNLVWGLDPLGIGQAIIDNAFIYNRTVFGDPYTMPSQPVVPTKWNGLLQQFVEDLRFNLRVMLTPDVFGVQNIAAAIILCGSGYGTLPNYQISGIYDSYPAPSSPPSIILPFGPSEVTDNNSSGANIDLGGTFALQILVDASGIYTLVPNQFVDKLYQRSGGTHTILDTAIPDPFAKTAFFGK